MVDSGQKVGHRLAPGALDWYRCHELTDDRRGCTVCKSMTLGAFIARQLVHLAEGVTDRRRKLHYRVSEKLTADAAVVQTGHVFLQDPLHSGCRAGAGVTWRRGLERTR